MMSWSRALVACLITSWYRESLRAQAAMFEWQLAMIFFDSGSRPVALAA